MSRDPFHFPPPQPCAPNPIAGRGEIHLAAGDGNVDRSGALRDPFASVAAGILAGIFTAPHSPRPSLLPSLILLPLDHLLPAPPPRLRWALQAGNKDSSSSGLQVLLSWISCSLLARCLLPLEIALLGNPIKLPPPAQHQNN